RSRQPNLITQFRIHHFTEANMTYEEFIQLLQPQQKPSTRPRSVATGRPSTAPPRSSTTSTPSQSTSQPQPQPTPAATDSTSSSPMASVRAPRASSSSTARPPRSIA
ncbi:hypothetical protein HK102_012579, partial [Quaeritorhiza haematococci]